MQTNVIKDIDRSKNSILFFDNAIENKKLVSDSLRFKFDCEVPESYEDFIEEISKRQYDFIILGEKNIETLEDIITDIKSTVIESPIILVSTEDNDPENRIKLFEIGADDFILSPYVPNELSYKIKKLLQYRDKQSQEQVDVLFLENQLEEQGNQLEQQQQVITTTMKQASKYGTTLQLIKKLHSCSNEFELSQTIFNYLEEWKLHAAIMFKDNNGSRSFFNCNNGECAPIEKKVLSTVGEASLRLHSFNTRSIFVGKHVSLLVKNMPVGHMNYDLYIDILATLIESIEAHYEFLLHTKSLEASQNKLENLIETIKTTMWQSEQEKNNLMDEFMLMIGQSFHVLDFNEEQEKQIQEMLEFLLRKHANHTENFIHIQEQASFALEILRKELDSSKQKMEKAKEEEFSLFTDDVELF